MTEQQPTLPADATGAAATDSRSRPAPRKHRMPAPEERQRDAERTRRNLLAAALDIFAAEGFAGARVQDIADRAGVNKQLISYYFGGKEGLYRALQQEWRQRESAFADPRQPLGELAVRYLRDARQDPRMIRLLLWSGLATDPADLPEETRGGRDLTGIRRRQEDGELAAQLDPACVLLFLICGISAPVALPNLVWQVLGMDPGSPQFEHRYGEQVRLIVELLSGAAGSPAPGPTGPGQAPSRLE